MATWAFGNRQSLRPRRPASPHRVEFDASYVDLTEVQRTPNHQQLPVEPAEFLQALENDSPRAMPIPA